MSFFSPFETPKGIANKLKKDMPLTYRILNVKLQTVMLLKKQVSWLVQQKIIPPMSIGDKIF
jgi:hypothetical protein